MNDKKRRVPLKRAAYSGLIIPTLAVLFNGFLLLYPREVIAAAREGLGLWFNNVLPSLLPFIIAVNMLTGMGFARFLGTLLSPIITPLFHVPGVGGFAFITGLTSGYPLGAKTVAQLRKDGLLDPVETQRLLGFCNNAGPLFIVGVAGTGLFGSMAAGYCLWLSHVSAALTMGLLMRFYRRDVRARRPSQTVRQAFDDLAAYRLRHDCSLGYVLGNSVKNGLEAITLIGGFIIFFCVMARVITLTGLPSWLAAHLPIDQTFVDGLLAGLMEVTNGVKVMAAATEGGGVLRGRLMGAAALISFGGLSIHAQTLYLIRDCGVHTGFYLLTKIGNAFLAAAYCFIFYRFFAAGMTSTVPAMRLGAGVSPWPWIWIPMLFLCGLIIFLLPSAVYGVVCKRLRIRR